MKLSDFSKRLSRIQDGLQERQLDLCVLANPIDLFYFTGLKLTAGKLWIAPRNAQLFVDRRYLQIAQEKSPIPVVLENEENLFAFLERMKGKKIAFDARHVTYFHYQQLKELLARFACARKLDLIAEEELFKRMRMIKDAQEIRKLQRSADLLWKGYQYVRKILKPGMSEKEVAKAFEIFCLKEGADGLGFEPIIAFGPNSAMPHHRATDAKWKKGALVLLDIGIVVDKYQSDMTRIILPPRCDPEIKQLYCVVREAQRAALSLCRPKVKIGALDDAARGVMKEAGAEAHFLHSLGHGLGLETHEFPVIRATGNDRDVELEEGMVMAIEPGLYLSGKGGVRYEDTIVITKTGYRNFYPVDR
jgi:Xaa-Pro aminopeptidase